MLRKEKVMLALGVLFFAVLFIAFVMSVDLSGNKGVEPICDTTNNVGFWSVRDYKANEIFRMTDDEYRHVCLEGE